MSALENEVTRETVEFEHFGRTWAVPTKTRLSHMRRLKADPSNVGIVDAFLDGDQLATLAEIDPTDDELDAFTDKIGEAMGWKASGNS